MLNRLPTANLLDTAKEDQQFDLREWLNFLWRQWKFIATITTVAVLIGAVQLVRMTPLYTATAEIMLDPRKSKAMGDDAILSDDQLTFPAIESQIAVIRSTSLLQRVVEREHLSPSDPLNPSAPPKPKVAAGNGNPPANDNTQDLGGSSVLNRLYSTFYSAEKKTRIESSAYSKGTLTAVEGLRGSTAVTRVGNSYTIAIAFTATDPVRAARLANAIADAYIIDKLDTRFEAAKRSSAWLSDRLTELRKQVHDSEEEVGRFRAEHNLLQGTANITLNQQQLNELNGRLVSARAEMAEKKARLDLLQSVQNKGDDVRAILPDMVKDSTVLAALRTQSAQISQREADLVARYGDRHPLVVNVRAERRDVEHHIASEISKLASNVKNDYELAKARADSLEQSLRQVTGQSDTSNNDLITLRELERTAAVNKSLFDDFMQRAKITQEQSTFEVRDARIITPAQPPSLPSYPSKGRVMGMSVVLGLLFGVAAALGKELLNSGFTTPRQVEDMLGLPVLTSISRMDKAELTIDGKQMTVPAYVTLKPLSRVSESVRSMRSGIMMTDVDNPPKIIQITSSVPSEGKTTIALCLAASVASSGAKVLFVDADMRRPSGSKILGANRDKGLVDVLLGTVSLQEVIRFQPDMKFWALGAGSKAQNPPDLLSSERMKSLVMSFKSSFDFVVIDTPPAGPVIDPVIVAQIADKVVFVVHWASTARELVQNVVRQLSAHKNIAGLVFNQVDEKQAQKYGKYAYSYYYGARHYKNYYQS